ncbi:mitochondrial import receptor subunit TOM5-like protein [Gossypium australe]|uniref:Mitochondrial import receptor subunit TOM5-like protein n=6 Tax=Gossypium TaxID=3633 RepID=A0A5B6UHU4_9ROSI|nr:mitochondrial import receptor subunit TOM5-like protein [Gossypium australe]
MADTVISLDKLKAFWNSQVHDEENWAHNMNGRFLVSAFLVPSDFHCHGIRPPEFSAILACSGNEQKLLRAAGLFAGSILLMRNYGDLMAI